MIPLKIGITGGIGSGKSFVADKFRKLGYTVFDCDRQAKKLMTTDEVVIRDLKNVLGDEAYIYDYDEDGKQHLSINKRFIANFLFDNEKNAQMINSIVHTNLAAKFQYWAKRQTQSVVFMESAILFESGFSKLVDYSLLVYADQDVRIRRAIIRDNTSEEEIVKRMSQQTDADELKSKADFILFNNPTDSVDEQICLFLNKIDSLINH